MWHALSELFLDTELQPHDYRHIAAILRRSGYRGAELRTIFDEEVAPVFLFNFFDLAGEWAGWTEEEVHEIVLQSLRSGARRCLGRVGRRIFRNALDEIWSRLSGYLEEA